MALPAQNILTWRNIHVLIMEMFTYAWRLDRMIYMEQPESFEVKVKEHVVCKLIYIQYCSFAQD